MQPTDEIAPILGDFQTVSLDGLEVVRLMDRQDTKFIFSAHLLPGILLELQPFYSVLSVDGHQLFGYENLYFDTADFRFYRQHHNQSYTRFKVRYRKYVESNSCYLEVKLKNNKRRTVKSRVRTDDFSYPFPDRAGQLISDQVGMAVEDLGPKLQVYFSRITLASVVDRDRITIDFGLRVVGNGSEQHFHNLVIGEIKQSRFSPRAEFFHVMRRAHIRRIRFSKYCMGLLHTYPHIKYNRFKPKLLQLRRIMSFPSNRE